MIRLSFIVPFYNVESYIEECIRSLYNQDIPIEEYEVICVDDCSPDGSRVIVERLQREYLTLQLVSCPTNMKQGGARNIGMREAKGRYIWFVDSDDYIKPNCLKRMLERAERDNLDLLKFYYEHVPVSIENYKLKASPVISGSELIFEVDTGEKTIEKCCTAWCQLIKNDFLQQHNIVFPEYVQYEDDDFAYQLYAYADRVRLIDEIPYVVRTTMNSTTRRKTDYYRIKDIYAQAIRMMDLDASLSQQDPRWHNMIAECINDCINNCVFRMLNDLSLIKQLHFWIFDREKVWRLKPYLARKSFAKLCFYTLWRVLQK